MSAALTPRVCACGCGAPLEGRRASALYFEGRCRVRAHRARRGHTLPGTWGADAVTLTAASGEIERLARKRATSNFHAGTKTETLACSCLHPNPMLDGRCERCQGTVPAELRGAS